MELKVNDPKLIEAIFNGDAPDIYFAPDVDTLISEKDALIAELKSEIRRKEAVEQRWFEQCMEERSEAIRLKRALEKIAWFKLWNSSISTMNPEDGARQEFDKWKKSLGKFLKKAKNVHQYKHWIEEVAKHNVFKIDDYLLYNSEERPQVKVTLKKRRAGFGHCVVCVEFYWAIVQTIYVSNKEFEFASCGRDLRSIAEMMNNFHHERLSKAWRMIYG